MMMKSQQKESSDQVRSKAARKRSDSRVSNQVVYLYEFSGSKRDEEEVHPSNWEREAHLVTAHQEIW